MKKRLGILPSRSFFAWRSLRPRFLKPHVRQKPPYEIARPVNVIEHLYEGNGIVPFGRENSRDWSHIGVTVPKCHRQIFCMDFHAAKIVCDRVGVRAIRSEEHTSELQSHV